MSSRAGLRDVTDRLRDHIIASLHVGSLENGDRLPSIREVARELGEDQRKVARAYRALEGEGLVEVRGRSGVYAAPQARLGGGMLGETAEWLAGALLEAWKRRISLLDFPDLVRRCTTQAAVRCAFLDSCEDSMEAFGYELRDEFGLQVAPVWLQALHGVDSAAAGAGSRFPAELREADLVVTTNFNASAVRTVLRGLNKPTVVVSVHPQAVATVINHLQQGSLTLVCVDASFGDRIRLQYGEHIRSDDQLRVVLTDDREALAGLDRAEPVLLTRAARRRLGDAGLNMLVPHSPTLAPASAHEIIRLLIRMNLDAATASA